MKACHHIPSSRIPHRTPILWESDSQGVSRCRCLCGGDSISIWPAVSLLVWAPWHRDNRGQPRSPRSPEGNDGVTAIGIERFILVIKSCINFAISLLQSKQENSSISFTWKPLLVEIGLWKFFSFPPSYSSSLHYPLGWAQALLTLHQKSVVPSFPCLLPSSQQVLIPLHPISCHTLPWIPDPHSLRSPHSTLLSCQSRLCEAQWGCRSSQRPKPSPADCLKAWKERISKGKWLFRDLWCVCRFLVLLRSCPWVAPSSPSLVHSFHPVFSFPQPHLRLSKCYSGFSRGGTGSKVWASGGILYHGVRTTLGNPRTTLKVARGPHPPHTCRDASGNRHHLKILPGLLASCAPAELGFPVFPCVVPRGSPRGLHGTPGSREGLRVGWIPVATQTPSGAPKSPEQPSSNQCLLNRIASLVFPLSLFFARVDTVISRKVKLLCDATPHQFCPLGILPWFSINTLLSLI